MKRLLLFAFCLLPFALLRAAPPPTLVTPYSRSLIATSSTPAQMRSGLGIVHGTNTAFNNLQFATDTEWRIIKGARLTNALLMGFDSDIGANSLYVATIGVKNADMGTVTNCVILGADTSDINDKAFYCLMGPSTASQLYGKTLYGLLLAGNQAILGEDSQAYTIKFATLLNGDNNTITGACEHVSIMAGDYNILGQSTNSMILGGTGNWLQNVTEGGYILGGHYNRVWTNSAWTIGDYLTNRTPKSVMLGYGKTNLTLTTTGAVFSALNAYIPIVYATGAVVIAQSDAYLSAASITNKLNVAAGKTNHMLINTNGVLLDLWSDGFNIYSKALAP